jgi:uncharacterized membrane protein YphA (DoxX/SURF4 family)
MTEIFFVGRLVFGGFLLFAGSSHFTQLGALAAAAAQKGVPLPTAAVLSSGALLLVAGVTFTLGLAPRLGQAALVTFLIPVTFVMHAFWREDGPARVLDFAHFTKNLAILGATLMFSVIPEPWAHGARPQERLTPRAQGRA